MSIIIELENSEGPVHVAIEPIFVEVGKIRLFRKVSALPGN
jgi:hypothetical protein